MLGVVGVAQLVEHRIVAPEVVGSIPIVHPIFDLLMLCDCFFIPICHICYVANNNGVRDYSYGIIRLHLT